MAEENTNTTVNFTASLKDTEPRIFPLENYHAASSLTVDFPDLWNFGAVADRYACLSLLADFISFIARAEGYTKEGSARRVSIEPAIEYLKGNLYNPALRVDRLHRIVGISDTYFRRLFEERFNMSPREYVVSERIRHAKAIIDSGDYATLAEVAASVGYSDPLYFSKEFKRFYGTSPSGVNK